MRINGIEIDTFVGSYLSALLWSSQDESTPDGGKPLDVNYCVGDFSEEALRKAVADCEAFREQADQYLHYRKSDESGSLYENPIYTDDEFAGHDFWLTRNRHGVGFWDRGLGDIGDSLTRVAESFGEQYPSVGDDGKIHID